MKFFLISVLFFLTFFYTDFAQAQSYEVKIRQLNPEGSVAEATCMTYDESICFFTVQIEPAAGVPNEGDKNLDVGIRFYQNKANVNFMWNREYALTGLYEQREKGVDIPLDNKGQGYKKLSLHTRSLLQQSESETLMVLRQYKNLAQIEIGIRRVDNNSSE
jgi:hypothetical protein